MNTHATKIGFLTLVLGLVLAGCGKDATPGTNGSSDDKDIPSVSIGECQTAQGSQTPAEPKGVDFKTQLKQPGVLNVGSDNAYPPFEEIKPGATEPEGFDVDLYTEVAKRLGLTPKSTTTDFDALFTTSVPNGTFDIGVSAITIKEERKQTVDFTVPYFEADLSLAVNAQTTPDIKTIDDLTDKTIGAQKGTTGEDCANFLVKEGKAKEVKSYGDAQAAFLDLSNGRIAAVVNDRPASQGFIEKDEDLEVVQIIETKEQYGFAISKDKPDLRVAINEQLEAIMKDGTYATIYEKWFGTKPPFDVPLS
ncbi:MAG TPA: basic amino acid ABC transporter substrate-binding protein [Actinomycetota bacterium]|nr:basic amino acid ABC transporter substrate-binding protein [Actinomycetota bacterium]